VKEITNWHMKCFGEGLSVLLRVPRSHPVDQPEAGDPN
jgi:hypothetical protein